MQRHLDSGLTDLKQRLVVMAGLVERAVECAVEASRTQNRERIREVFEIEEKVNECHIDVDAHCLTLFATQQPMAGDLRLVLATVKINSDLERMVDQAVNIASNIEHCLQCKATHAPTADLGKMGDEVRVMVREAINAFVQGNEATARDVLERDDKVDAYKDKIFRDIQNEMKKDPSLVEEGLNWILIARNLERIGDHATNIAEDVIFTVSGEDVRHGPTVEKARNK